MRYITSGFVSVVATLGLVWEFVTGQVGQPDDVRSGAAPLRLPAGLFWIVITVPVLALLGLLYALPAARSSRSTRVPVASATAAASAACPAAASAGYGFSPDDPIALGGGEFSGPLRTSAYLQNLRGPQGEAVTFEPRGTLLQAGRPLHVFQITSTGLSAPRLLYLDYERSAEVYVPQGMTCAAPLALPRA
jgi:hypothetical protein